MKEWKVRQQLYHQLATPDDINIVENPIIELSNVGIVRGILDYFTIEVEELIYPSKSYCVALIYSRMLEHIFDEDFYECLDDPDLLFNNDKYFVRYSDSKSIYDTVIPQLPIKMPVHLSQVRTTIDYFNKEFLLDDSINQSYLSM